ncbi:hypothetical protein J2T09_000371 [Neorhizobium huautlense]|uniref:Dirigent protein n=1 Tax=Neorhizobium huautlense TaxID=67774 RepID=A0ABT9PMF5_9HYPH|nr:hypothetical protein [Neorhizobium huautlense]MDP9835630.1 hypothetical protein [Neorhizobium huautlense]
MVSSISISPPNSLVFVSGGAGDFNSFIDQYKGEVVFATPTVIGLGTLCEIDGPTRITLAKGHVDAGGLSKSFSGSLQGLNGRLVVGTCEGDVLLSGDAASAIVTIEVFSNDPSEPNEILIVYS